jgi:hypothetical protein
MAEKKTVTNRVWLALLVVVLCCALLSYGCSSQAMSPASSIQQAGDKDPIFTSCSCNDPAGTIDPGQDKDVGCCTCVIEAVVNATNATVTIGNAYPGYECNISFTIRNTASQAVNITSVNVTAPLAIDVIADPGLNGTTLQPGEEAEGFINVHVNDSATQSTTYNFTVKIDGD